MINLQISSFCSLPEFLDFEKKGNTIFLVKTQFTCFDQFRWIGSELATTEDAFGLAPAKSLSAVCLIGGIPFVDGLA